MSLLDGTIIQSRENWQIALNDTHYTTLYVIKEVYPGGRGIWVEYSLHIDMDTKAAKFNYYGSYVGTIPDGQVFRNPARMLQLYFGRDWVNELEPLWDDRILSLY